MPLIFYVPLLRCSPSSHVVEGRKSKASALGTYSNSYSQIASRLKQSWLYEKEMEFKVFNVNAMRISVYIPTYPVPISHP